MAIDYSFSAHSRPSWQGLWVACVLGLLGAFGAIGAAAAERPNILFIMSDDHASHAISAYGSKVNQTPHLDRLAKEGMLFENAFITNSICTPSRATLLTGKYSHANGTPVFNRFNSDQPLVSRMMQTAGYWTGQIGKWHLGSDPVGFDQWEILPGQGAYKDPVFYTQAGPKTYAGEHATETTTKIALRYLEERPKDKPFLIFCHHKAPHRDWIPQEKHRRMFENRVIPEPATFNDDWATRGTALKENRQRVDIDLRNRDLKLPPPSDLKPGPELQKWMATSPDSVDIEVNGQKKTLTGQELKKWKYQRYMQDYLACVQGVDDSVGELLDYLDKNGLRENTIVIYTTDNGFFLGDHGLYDKRFMYEHSLRIPFLVRWPAVIKPGTRAKQLVINTDFAPTFLSAAAAAVPADMQGVSLVPLFRGESPDSWRKSFYYRYYHDPGDHNSARHVGVRTETHKLIHFWKKDEWECFDLVKDPDEMTNIYASAEAQSTVAALKAEMARLKSELKDEDQFAETFPASGVDGAVEKLRKGLPPDGGKRGAAQREKARDSKKAPASDSDPKAVGK